MAHLIIWRKEGSLTSQIVHDVDDPAVAWKQFKESKPGGAVPVSGTFGAPSPQDGTISVRNADGKVLAMIVKVG